MVLMGRMVLFRLFLDQLEGSYHQRHQQRNKHDDHRAKDCGHCGSSLNPEASTASYIDSEANMKITGPKTTTAGFYICPNAAALAKSTMASTVRRAHSLSPLNKYSLRSLL